MGTSSRILTLSLSSTIRLSNSFITIPKLYPFRRVIYQGFIPLSTIQPSLESSKHSILLERLRIKHLKDSVGGNNNANKTKKSLPLVAETADKGFKSLEKKNEKDLGFSELGLSEEVLGALGEMGIAVPTEIQRLGIPAVLDEKSVVLGSHTGSGKTHAYLLPLVQASIARKIYLRGGLGVFQRIYGGRNRNGSAPPHFCKSSGGIIRHILQQLETMKIIDMDPKGGRSLLYQTIIRLGDMRWWIRLKLLWNRLASVTRKKRWICGKPNRG